MAYHAKFGSSVANGVRVHTGLENKRLLGAHPLGCSEDDPIKSSLDRDVLLCRNG